MPWNGEAKLPEPAVNYRSKRGVAEKVGKLRNVIQCFKSS